MKNILDEYVEKIKKSRHQYRRYTLVVAVLALFTIIGVNWGLHRDGIAITAESLFGQEENQASAEDQTQAEATLSAEKTEQDASEELGGADSTNQNQTETDSAAAEEKEDASSQHAASSFDAENKDADNTAANHTTNKSSANEADKTEEKTESKSGYSDDGADLEEAADWEATLPTEYSGDWAQDLVAVAASQLGYQESTANYRLSEDGTEHKGYSRYGEFYGNPYGDWSCMFADFCLYYAGISEDELPVNSGAEAWIVDLTKAELYQDAAAYEPKEGDLVFLDQEENDGLADHVGIISSLKKNEDDKLISFRAIEGDSYLEGESSGTDMVVENEFEAGDSRISGYAKLPQNPDQISQEESESESADAKKTEQEEKKSETESDKAGEQTAETDNYIVKVSYDEKAQISADATLKVTEFDKDSEEYKKACEETGESYDWLLDISFFRGDKEVEPKSPIQIAVTLKDKTEVIDEETELTVTHFAEEGTEVKEGDDLQLQEDKKGRSQISFELDSLSLVAGQTYHPATVVTASSFSQGNSYLVYKASGDYIYFLAGLSGSPVTFKVALSELARYSEDSLTADFASAEGSTIYYKGYISGTVIPSSGSSYSSTLSWSNLLWSNGGGNLKNAVTSTYLRINSSLSLNSSAQSITLSQGSSTNYSRFYQSQSSGWGWWGQQTTYYYLSFANEKISASQTNNTYSFSNADLTLAQVGSDYTPSDGSGSGEAVYTGSLDSLPLGFYSVTLGEDDVVSGLAGVVYTIYNSNGQVAGTLTTSSDLRVDLSGLQLADGDYTMKMTHVPDGYLLDEETWSFTYSSSAKSLSMKDESGEMTGIILINHESKLEMDKTASVLDYANRTYQVDLSAKSNLEQLKVDDLTIHLVVDQSNSMLFPAGLDASNDGTLTVRYVGARDKRGSVSGNLDTHLVYYAIADKSASATVWAIFYQNGSWWYQDASYFAKAYYNGQTDKIKTSDNISFPTAGAYASACHGGKLDGSSNMYGANLAAVSATTTYELYTASSQYNRLHYLEQSINDMLQMLAEINPNATVTLDTFTSSPQTCVSAVLGKNNGLETLQTYVGDITTDGGTRQDLALEHVRNTHSTTGSGQYLILITDGAPVSSSPSVGTATDTANASGTVYERINYQAQMLKNNGVTLATVGLGMKDVESGSKALRYISTNGPSTSASVTGDHGEWWFQPENAAELTSILCDQILSQITSISKIENSDETVVDYISDSFYPIDKATGKALADGELIDSDGNKVSAGSTSAVGTVRVDGSGAFYVEWLNCDLNQTDGWKGTICLKAKEDFIGGNAINTNKSATLTLSKGGVYEFDKPTVNVHLLEMNSLSSQVTVYKGDIINEEGSSPEDSLRSFFEKIEFSKLLSGSGDTYNKVGKGEADGCKAATFTLEYALGRSLTEDEWTRLKNGESISLPYSYDDTDGELGYFTISLSKTGTNADYDSHEAKEAKGTENAIETYTLNVSYTAYRLGDAGGNKRPDANVHNGAAGPGTEVGSVETTLAEGKGTVKSESTHTVYAIDGQIQVRKVIEEDLKSESDQTYTFTLYRINEDDTKEKIGDSQSLTVKAGSTSAEGSVIFTGLARGSYIVTETSGDDYVLEKVEIEDGTNCQSTGAGSTEVTFTLGNDTTGANVIGKSGEDRYSSYTGSPNGVLGKAVFTNKKQNYSASLPVKKVWDDSKDHRSTPVYLVLYKDNAMVTSEGEDGSSLAQVIRLDETNAWQGSFTIPLTGKDDTVSPGSYSVRELKGIQESAEDKQAALLVNDQSIIYFSIEDIMSEEDIAAFGGQSYQVYYSKESAAEGSIDTLVVKNAAAYELPKTGGMGSRNIQIGGLLLLAGGIAYGFVLRRRRERRSK